MGHLFRGRWGTMGHLFRGGRGTMGHLFRGGRGTMGHLFWLLFSFSVVNEIKFKAETSLKFKKIFFH